MTTWRDRIRSMTDRQRLKALEDIFRNCFHPLGADADVRWRDSEDGRPGEFYWSHTGEPLVTEDNIEPAHVIIDGVRYVPAGEVPPITDERLKHALESLTEIQYFSDQEHKHRAWAWDALNALAPEIAKMASQDSKAAFDRIHGMDE